MNKVKVLLVEYNFFHDEVVIPIIDLLTNINEVELHCVFNEKILERNTFELTENIKKIKEIIYVNKKLPIHKQLLNLKYIYTTYKYILNNKINIVFFNTIDVYNLDVKILLYLLPKNIKKIGILHNINIMKNDFLKKFDQIFILNECININYKKSEVLYPIIYKYKKIINKKPKHIITIPGNIEVGRRNYNFIIEFVKSNKNFLKTNNIKFNLLGNIEKDDGKNILKLIRKNKLEEYFIIHYGFINYKDFIKNIQDSLCVMPLLNNDSYLKYKTSTALNMSFSLNKPLLIEKKYKKCNFLENFTYFYSNENLNSVLEKIINDKSLYLKKINNILEYEKFNLDYQINKLRKII